MIGGQLYPNYKKYLYDRYVNTHLPKEEIEHLIKEREPFLCHIISEYFPKDCNAKILELGCGYGAMIYFARRAGYKYVEGVDISKDQIEEAKRFGIEGIIHCDLIGFLHKIRDSSLDLVIAFDLCEHFKKGKLFYLLKDINRVLKNNGTLLLHIPNATSPFFGRVRYGDFTHEMAFTQGSIRQLLRSLNYRNVKCFEDNPIVHNVKSFLRWILWKCIRSIFSLIVMVEAGDKYCLFSQNIIVTANKLNDHSEDQ